MSASATSAPPPSTAVAPSGGKSGIMWKIIVLAFILAVIGGECLVAFAYLNMSKEAASSTPAPEPAASHADGAGEKPAAKHGAEHGKEGAHGKEASHGKEKGHGKEAAHGGAHGGGEGHTAEELEIDMGEFSLTAFQPASNTTMLVNFHLYGTIRSAEEGGFAGSYEANKHRIREQVLMTVRSAEIGDLTDPGLGLIKRQILEKTNRALGKPFLDGVIFSDFLVVEQ